MDEEEQQVVAAGVNLAEAFHQWRLQAEAPEEKLNMQAVSDAWDLVIFRDEQYTTVTAKVRAEKYNGGVLPCRDCDDEHEHSKKVTDA